MTQLTREGREGLRLIMSRLDALIDGSDLMPEEVEALEWLEQLPPEIGLSEVNLSIDSPGCHFRDDPTTGLPRCEHPDAAWDFYCLGRVPEGCPLRTAGVLVVGAP
jgi:hypothetical protein